MTIDLPATMFYTHAPITLPVHVICGKKPGPHLFLTAAIHGDEINGVEIIRRVLQLPVMQRIKGVLLALPIVNLHGFLHHSRYLPDRRDLNRSFPGSVKGPLASRLAYLLMHEVVAQCSHGIDLHTGAQHRFNLPQIRADLSDDDTYRLGAAFRIPVLIDSHTRDGSLRHAAVQQGLKVLLYEAGEALRFDEMSIKLGVRGIVNVMRELGMLAAKDTTTQGARPMVSTQSRWIRAPGSGILRSPIKVGDRVKRRTELGIITDPFGEQVKIIRSPLEGIVIGQTFLPLANEGDALFNIAAVKDLDRAAAPWEDLNVVSNPNVS